MPSSPCRAAAAGAADLVPMTWDDGTPYVDELADGRVRLRAARRRLDGEQLRRRRGRRGTRGPGRHHLDREAQPRGARRGREGQHRRTEARSSTPTTTPTTPTATASCPPRRSSSATTSAATRCCAAGLEATKVITAPDYGDLTLRPPELTFAGPDDAAPRRVPGRAAARRRPGAHHATTSSSGCPSRRCCSPATWPSTAVSRSSSRARSPASAARSRRCAELAARGARARPRSGLPRRGGGRRCWATMDDYLAYVEHVAAESYAAGLTPLEAAQKNRDNPYSDWAETERFVGNLHRAYSELDRQPDRHPAHRPVGVAGHGRLPRRPDRLPRMSTSRCRPAARAPTGRRRRPASRRSGRRRLAGRPRCVADDGVRSRGRDRELPRHDVAVGPPTDRARTRTSAAVAPAPASRAVAAGRARPQRGPSPLAGPPGRRRSLRIGGS